MQEVDWLLYCCSQSSTVCLGRTSSHLCKQIINYLSTRALSVLYGLWRSTLFRTAPCEAKHFQKNKRQIRGLKIPENSGFQSRKYHWWRLSIQPGNALALLSEKPCSVACIVRDFPTTPTGKNTIQVSPLRLIKRK